MTPNIQAISSRVNGHDFFGKMCSENMQCLESWRQMTDKRVTSDLFIIEQFRLEVLY